MLSRDLTPEIKQEVLSTYSRDNNVNRTRDKVNDLLNIDLTTYNVRVIVESGSGQKQLKGLIESKWLPVEDVKHWWIKDGETSFFVKNPYFQEYTKEIGGVFDNIIQKYSNLEFDSVCEQVTQATSKKACQVIVSDSHLWLNPNPNTKALFEYEYNGKIYNKNFLAIFDNINKEYQTHGKFEELILADLWDREDWFNGFTTRGGHKLPQNMTDAEVFETLVDSKVALLKKILELDIADKIIIRDVVNSNHSSSFAHIVSLWTKKILELLYWNRIEVDILEKYIEAREYGDHTFLYTHWKDDSQQFKWLPLHLTDRATNFINDYIHHYNVSTEHIHLLKWDLHQIWFNKTKRFDYRNMPSFAPPSNWSQHNFWDSYSWYSIQVIPKDSNAISHTDYFLDYKKKTWKTT